MSPPTASNNARGAQVVEAAPQVEALEQAILERARSLVEEYEARARRARDNILKEAADRIRLREDREVLAAQAEADRVYRRRVQASELKLQKHLDRLRWELVEEVHEALRDRLEAVRQDRDAYRSVLAGLVRQAARTIPDVDLIVAVSDSDHGWLEDDWIAFAEEAAPGRICLLCSDTVPISGGVEVRDPENRVRIDHSFEGRIRRMQARLDQIIVERLLPAQDSGALNVGYGS
ncbi:MAG: V-type ATP synthase subunit E [Gammaproteobacteria bacterium]